MNDLYYADIGLNPLIVESIKITNRLDYNRECLRKTLNDNGEFDRLCDLVKAEHNCYGSQEEIYILDILNKVLLTGIDSHYIDSVQSIKLLYWSCVI